MKIKVFHFLLGFTLKQKGVLYFCFPTKRQIMLSTILPPPPSISAVIATLECVWKKRRRGQQHSVSPCHMDQHISHQGTAGVFFICCYKSSTMHSVFIQGGEMCTHRGRGAWN